jgi:NMD protein affecting ribosome stability and mRNA decay
MADKSKHIPNDYYEAIVQVRPKKKDVLIFVANQVEKRKDVFISEVKVKEEGYDIFISSQKFARALGKKLKNRFGGTLKLSHTLFSRDRTSGKDIYRATVLLRLQEEDI